MFIPQNANVLQMRKGKPIFTITTIREPADKIPGGQPRCVGFYHSKDIAIESVEHNSCDIYEEGYYPYVVIEEFLQGIYPYPIETWFRWNKRSKGYVRTKERPKVFEHIVCFGLG